MIDLTALTTRSRRLSDNSRKKANEYDRDKLMRSYQRNMLSLSTEPLSVATN